MVLAAGGLALARPAAAQDAPTAPDASTGLDAPLAPEAPMAQDTPSQPSVEPVAPVRTVPLEVQPEPMSEGRRIVSAYNTGFQWGLSPGVVFSGAKASFFLGVRLGYGFDLDKVILVPGVRLAGYFTDPNVYVGLPVLKLIYPIERFAPFVEGGAGIGYVEGSDVGTGGARVEAKAGASLLVGGGFMVHVSWKLGLGVEANYQVITGTSFKGFGIAPILAIGF
jgi:hypothetical protein